MPILWRNPGQTLLTKKAGCLLFDVTLLHLSEESRDILKNQGYNNLITETYQRPLFNYINFCKYLDLLIIERMISSKNIERSNASFIRNIILKLFINGNKKLIYLSIRQNYDYQLPYEKRMSKNHPKIVNTYRNHPEIIQFHTESIQ